MDLPSLKPYHGYQSSIIPCASGYYFYLASWDCTPTQFPQFSNVWLVTPQDKRILFSDPPDSSQIVCIYHEFQEIYGASIGVDWITQNEFHVDCSSLDGSHSLQIRLQLQEPLSSRMLVALGSGPPTPFKVSKGMVAASNFLVNVFAAGRGSVLLGKTETGQLFYHGDAERLYRVAGGSISLNGEDLGTVTRPTWPITFGDAVPYLNPVLKLGTLYIPYEPDMVEE